MTTVHEPQAPATPFQALLRASADVRAARARLDVEQHEGDHQVEEHRRLGEGQSGGDGVKGD